MLDDLANQLPENGVWYLAKCHKGDMKGKYYAEWSYVTARTNRLEFCYADKAEDALKGLIEKCST